jgi:hypothetical protein
MTSGTGRIGMYGSVRQNHGNEKVKMDLGNGVTRAISIPPLRMTNEQHGSSIKTLRVYLLTFTYSFVPIYTIPNRYLSTPKKM